MYIRTLFHILYFLKLIISLYLYSYRIRTTYDHTTKKLDKYFRMTVQKN